MPRVKIKHPDTSQERRLLLLRTLSENIIYATRIINAQDGFIVLTRSDEEIDKIFQEKVFQELKKNNFQAVLPPELKAKRTILTFNTDDFIFHHTEKEIEEELLAKNQWMKEGIDSIFKIPRTKIMKITFKEAVAAKKATDNGILGFHMSIPPHAIKIEEYVPLLTCLKCYAIEDHTTPKCPKSQTFKICSECSSPDHTWRDCNAGANKKCVNCKGEHRTLANKCPMRKKAIEEKRQLKKNTNTKTYSNVTTSNTNIAPTNISSSFPVLEKQTATKMIACMMHAHLINAINPGSYNSELNRALKLNNLPPVNLPDNPPSQKILDLTKDNQTPTPNENTQNTSNNTTQDNTNPPQHTEHTEQEDISQKEMPPLEKISGEAIGLQIITKKSEGWPKEQTFSLHRLKVGIDNGLYKFRYRNPTYTEEEILLYILNNDIDLTNCWCTTDDTQFNKIRNGLLQELTPPPNKATKTYKNRHRHSSN